MNELKIFENPAFGSIRTTEDNGKVLFCGADVARALGYADTAKAIKTHCKENGWANRPVIDRMGREQQAKFIDEGNLYRLITHSKLPEAEKFESWVFDDVLPSIRKHGMYATEELLDNPDFAIKVFNELKAEREKRKALETTVDVQKQLIGELKPKADYTDLVLKSKTLLTTTQIAKDYGMSGKKFNKLLNELKIQYKTGGYNKQWLLYSKYQDKGWTHSETIRFTRSDGREDFVLETKWTQKGRLGLYQLLKAWGILPMIEREDETE